MKKYRDHCHITGKFRGAACNKCNLDYNYKNFRLPVIFHNLKGYDSHFILQYIGKMNKGEIFSYSKYDGKIYVIYS
jgi:hypothetical protein